MSRISLIPYETVPLEKGYYHGVHGLINFNKEGGVDRKYYQADVEPDPGEYYMECVILYYER